MCLTRDLEKEREKQMKKVKIKQFFPTKKTYLIEVPGSKSVTNRALLLASCAQGRSTLSGVLESDDSKYCVESMKMLGNEITKECNKFYVTGSHENWKAKGTLYIGSAGTTARFLPGLIATMKSPQTISIDASNQLRSRPISELLTVYEQLGVKFDYFERKHHYPLAIHTGCVLGSEVSIAGDVSSQFISGLLLAGVYVPNGLKVKITSPIVQKQYVDITVEMMKSFGGKVHFDEIENAYFVKEGAYVACDYEIEADVSSACYFFAMALMFDIEINIKINADTMQPDIYFLDILEKLGACVKRHENLIIISGNSVIKGNQSFDLNACSDQALTLAAMAVFANGPITISNIGHIRNHESDRIEVIAKNMLKLGVDTEMSHDSITIYPTNKVNNVELETYDDHRVAMAFSLIAMKVGGITIVDPDCTKKTFPTYFSYLKSLGVEMDFDNKFSI